MKTLFSLFVALTLYVGIPSAGALETVAFYVNQTGLTATGQLGNGLSDDSPLPANTVLHAFNYVRSNQVENVVLHFTDDASYDLSSVRIEEDSPQLVLIGNGNTLFVAQKQIGGKLVMANGRFDGILDSGRVASHPSQSAGRTTARLVLYNMRCSNRLSNGPYWMFGGTGTFYAKSSTFVDDQPILWPDGHAFFQLEDCSLICTDTDPAIRLSWSDQVALHRCAIVSQGLAVHQIDRYSEPSKVFTEHTTFINSSTSQSAAFSSRVTWEGGTYSLIGYSSLY